jgi:predicted nucleotidyltransferase
MSQLSSLLQNKRARREMLEARLDPIVEQLKSLGAVKIVLFGSLARQEVDVDSDLDLLVIMPSHKSGKKWMGLLYEKLERGIATDIVAYNQEEFEAKLPESSFLRTIEQSGKTLYEKVI